MRKGVILFFTGVLLCGSVSTVFAWWDDINPPGSEVFDAKRFADSLRETVQAVLQVQNAWENLRNREIFHAGTRDGFPAAREALEDSIDSPQGSSLVNPAVNFSMTPFVKNWKIRDALSDDTYSGLLMQEQAASLEDSEAEQQRMVADYSADSVRYREILEMSLEGVLGERQKVNAAAVLDAVEAAEAVRANGGRLMHEITRQEAATARKRLEQEKAKAGAFYGYDPYHPSSYDRAHPTYTTTSFGFLSFGE